MYKTILIPAHLVVFMLDELENAGQEHSGTYSTLSEHWENWKAVEKAQQEREAQKQANRDRRNRKSQFRKSFEGLERFFNACWKEALKHESCTGEPITDDLLGQIASEKVNNPKSSFYLYGR